VCDHTAIPRRLADAMSTTWYDTVATLGWLAGITSRVRLLSHVYVAALRHPLRAAKEFATLDALSGGRLIVGVGTGHVTEEFALAGVDFARRGALLDEAI
ncbi:MAG TPA: LLM class F420-dependent oxidoreductase, partial [Acidimicrobiaceae bacterium]|nr:LLM class F420-dependent oxidoreductase [Acidimicrobiaceae bacterium]